MSEGITCYEQDETLCEDRICLRVGCQKRNERRGLLVEQIAIVLASYLPDAIGTHFSGAPYPAKFPQQFGSGEQAGFRLVAREVLQAIEGNLADKERGAHLRAVVARSA
jgi:hypothetical protein